MKKLNKFFAVLVALAMMATLCVMTAFASPADPDKTKNEVAATSAYLTKYLKIDEGVTVPDAEFTFTFTPKTSETVNASEFTEKTTSINATAMRPSNSIYDDGNLVGNILLFGDANAQPATTGIFDNYNFPHYGEYIFEVTETLPAVTDDDKGEFGENIQKYTLHIYYSADGKSVTVSDSTPVPDIDPETGEQKTDPETGDPIYTDPTETKEDASDTDPSDGDDDTPDDPDEPKEDGDKDKDKTNDEIDQFNVEGFTFVNDYELKEAYQPNGYGAFYTEKTVTGAYGNTTTAKFPFTITVDFGTYNGDRALDIVDATGEKIGELDADTGSALVWLKHGEIAAFKNLPDGAKVTVTEDLRTNDAATNANNVEWYAQTAKSYENDAAKGTDVVVPDKTKESHAASTVTANQVEYKDAYAKAKNAVEITNKSTYEPSTTGILLSNLPYIVLALVAVGGMVAYVVIRRRQSDEA